VTGDQIFVFAVLAAALGLFAWGRWRYDLVAVAAMAAVVLRGIVPADQALLGFGHPAVVTVAAVLVISCALRNSGIVEVIAQRLEPLTARPAIHIAVLTGVVTLCSGFMNNVGALALMLPVALATAEQRERSPALLLMPLAFGSILGGLTTMIGTPPNIIVAAYRADVAGSPFGLFDFTPVGGPVALAGVAFVALIGWHFIPKARRGRTAARKLFEIGEYMVEVRVGEKSPLVGKRLSALESLGEEDVVPLGLVRGGKVIRTAPWHVVEAGDVMVLRADPADLQAKMDEAKLELAGAAGEAAKGVASEDAALIESVVKPGSPLAGRAPSYLYWRSRGSLTLLALARQDRPILRRPWAERFREGDVLLLQAELEDLGENLAGFGLLPLAERELKLGKPRQLGLALGIFGVAIVANLLGLVPVFLAFVLAIVAFVLAGILPVRDVYKEIDWPVIVLLGAMIPVGQALEISGGTQLAARSILGLTGGVSPVWVLALVLVATMFLSDVINNAATAVLMAPIAVQVAEGLGVNADPFLMAVAVGASCAFLTPIGHQSNTLVMGPGGYRFGDYWKMGLPLEVVIAAVAIPAILWVWPLN
jgi:di/tricarboxylate transporter